MQGHDCRKEQKTERHVRVIVVPEAFCKGVVINLQLRDLKEKRKCGINIGIRLRDKRAAVQTTRCTCMCVQ